MCDRYRTHDGQTQAMPEVAAYSLRVEALERLEESINFGRRDYWSGVAHCEPGAAVATASRYVNTATFNVVHDGIPDEVGHQRFQQPGVTLEMSGRDGRVDAQPEMVDVATVEHNTAGYDSQVHGFAVVESALTAGKCEQSVDQSFLFPV